jgi:hypothetical protein
MDELTIKINGQVTSSNFDAWRDQMRTALSRVKTELSTDADFREAEQQAKAFQAAEKKLDQAKLSAQEQSADIHALFGAIDEVKESVRQTRLTLQRQIKVRKAAIRSELIETAITQVQTYLTENDTNYKTLHASEYTPRHLFESTIKGASGIPSAQKKLDQLVFKIQQQIDVRLETIDTNAAQLDQIPDKWSFLFPDREYLLSTSPSSKLQELIARRIQDYQPPVVPEPAGRENGPDAPPPDPPPSIEQPPEPPSETQLIELLQTMGKGINPLTKRPFSTKAFGDLPALMKALSGLAEFIADQSGEVAEISGIKKPNPEGLVSTPRPTPDPPAPDAPEYDLELYDKLRTWRFEKTKELHMSPYIIFNNKSLEQIAGNFENIQSPEDLLEISGMGARKLELFGIELFDLIQAHRHTNNTKPSNENHAAETA